MEYFNSHNQFISGGAVITNPPLNQNKTEGDLVNFSCEGEVTFELKVVHPFSAGNSWKPVYRLVPRQCTHSQSDQHAGTYCTLRKFSFI